MRAVLLAGLCASGALATAAQAQAIRPAEVDAAAKAVEAKTVAWRRDIHEHPELGNQRPAPPPSSPITSEARLRGADGRGRHGRRRDP